MGLVVQAMLSALSASVRRAPALRSLAVRSFRGSPAVACAKVPAQPDVFPAGELLSDLDAANGLRREEIEADLMGLERFEAEWMGPPGTKESPIVVESIAAQRIVGIPSRDDHDEEGEVRWFMLKAADGVVERHGQFWVLKQVEMGVAAGYERHH